MLSSRISSVATVFCLGLLFVCIPFSEAQDALSSASAEDAAEQDASNSLTIAVSVNEVRLDVVVLDGKGRPITDLTAADFEVYQNRLPQEVTSTIYINSQADVATQLATSPNDGQKLPPLPEPTLKKEEVRRTILFVVDNLSMEFAHLHYAKMAMKGFFEKQMQPGDLVAIMRTGYGNSALQMFLSDKRQLIARVDRIPADGAILEQDRDNLYRIYENQLSTLSYSIRALNDMPGRKILLFLSSMPTIVNPPPVVMGKIPVNYFEIYGPRFERLGNEAMRAGVVVHSMDTRGLEVEPDTDSWLNALNPLPGKTGGTYIENSNFFVEGVGKEVNNMIAGYYLVSYEPPTTTFMANRRDVFHRINVRVNRRGAKVYTRDGFYGRPDGETDAAKPPGNPLYEAVFSPFQFPDLNVNIAAGYIKDTRVGYLLRSWIHLDPDNVTMVETENGARINLETVCMTSDINGVVHDVKYVNHTFDIKSESIAWIQKHGIRFSLMLPIKNPGSYTVRVAVQDMESGKVGSAYQFVEVPNIEKKGLALSDLFMITSAGDLDWMLLDVTEKMVEGVFSPIFQASEVRSPALRTYTSGDRLQTLAILYNSDADALARSEIEMQYILYRDGVEFLRSAPRAILPDNLEKIDSVLILRNLTLGSDMLPGDYVQQLVVTDKKNSKKKGGITSQTLSFTVADSPGVQ